MPQKIIFCLSIIIFLVGLDSSAQLPQKIEKANAGLPKFDYSNECVNCGVTNAGQPMNPEKLMMTCLSRICPDLYVSYKEKRGVGYIKSYLGDPKYKEQILPLIEKSQKLELETLEKKYKDMLAWSQNPGHNFDNGTKKALCLSEFISTDKRISLSRSGWQNSCR